MYIYFYMYMYVCIPAHTYIHKHFVFILARNHHVFLCSMFLSLVRSTCALAFSLAQPAPLPALPAVAAAALSSPIQT